MEPSFSPLHLVVLVPPGVALLWTVRLVYGRRGAASDDLLKRVLTLAGKLLLLLGLSGLLFGVFGPMSILGMVVVPMVLLMAIGQFRQSERRALLSMLGVAAERSIPLEAAARAFAEERADELGLRAVRLADLLASGIALPEALRGSGHRWLPIDAELAVRVGWEFNALGPALRCITGMRQGLQSSLKTLGLRYQYLLVLFAVATGTVTFVMLRIIPMFTKMFSEFELKLPPPTLFLVNLSKGSLTWSPLLVLAAILLSILAAIEYLGALPRWLPVLSRLTRRYDGALVMRTLALTVRLQRSLAETIRLLARFYPLGPVRARLGRASQAIDQGADWRLALVTVGLLRPVDATVLQSAERVGNLEWALEEMADSGLRAAIYRWQTAINLATPVAVLGLGLGIAFLVIALFMPLISLIQGLSGG